MVLRARTEDNEEAAVKVVSIANATSVDLVSLADHASCPSTFITSNRSRFGGPSASFPSSENVAIVRSLN